MTDPSTTLQQLSTRGITTLEQLVESKAPMRKPQRIDSEKALQEMLARSAPPDPSFKSKIGPPASSVALVLDGKRVDYGAIARLNGQPLDYVVTTLKGGEQALVMFSDRAIMRNHRSRQFKGALQAINQDVEKALAAGGLHPSLAITRGIGLGAWLFTDAFFQGDILHLAPNDFAADISDLGWSGRISSILLRGCWCQIWEDINEGGASLIFYEDQPDLHGMGWNDRIGSIFCGLIG